MSSKCNVRDQTSFMCSQVSLLLPSTRGRSNPRPSKGVIGYVTQKALQVPELHKYAHQLVTNYYN